MKRFLISALRWPRHGPPPGRRPPSSRPPGGAADEAGAAGAARPRYSPSPRNWPPCAAKSEQIEAAVKDLRARHADPDLVGDVEVYAKTGRILLEYPELFNNQNAIDHALTVLDQGIERAKQLAAGNSPWTSGKKQIHAYYSAIDGSVQPYAITLPENYDPAKPARLYVWLHGRQNNTTESEFIFAQQTFRPGNVPVADQGQIQVDLFGRINGAGWHWAGEADIFEGIAAVKKRFKIDDKRDHAARLLAWAARAPGTSRCTTRIASPPPRSARAHGRAAPRLPDSSRINTPPSRSGKTWRSGGSTPSICRWPDTMAIPTPRSPRSPDRRPARRPTGSSRARCARAPSSSARALPPRAIPISCVSRARPAFF